MIFTLLTFAFLCASIPLLGYSLLKTPAESDKSQKEKEV